MAARKLVLCKNRYKSDQLGMLVEFTDRAGKTCEMFVPMTLSSLDGFDLKSLNEFLPNVRTTFDMDYVLTKFEQGIAQCTFEKGRYVLPSDYFVVENDQTDLDMMEFEDTIVQDRDRGLFV